MQKKQANDFDPEVLRLFDKFVHGIIDRRGFLNGAAKYAVGGVTATMLLEMLSPQFAAAQVVKPDDKRITTQFLEYESRDGYGKIRGYLAMPAGAKGKLKTVLVVHENRGLNPHIEDIARRLALDGFLAFAPDALTPLGGYPGDEDKARELFAKLDQNKSRNDFIAAARFIQLHPNSNGKFGAVGFCYGGGIVNMLATKLPDMAAGVPFYGSQPPAAEVANIKAPLLIQYAENDERINAGWPAFDAELKKAGVPHEMFKYAGTQHGFNNDTTPRFDEAAAKLAWSRTIAFFNQHLG
jgi:carboxymethylenebutenolidase